VTIITVLTIIAAAF